MDFRSVIHLFTCGADAEVNIQKEIACQCLTAIGQYWISLIQKWWQIISPWLIHIDCDKAHLELDL